MFTRRERNIVPLLLLVLIVLSPSVLSAICPRVDWEKTVVVKQINDGDTITLENGKLVRFIGINTPEINYRNISASAPYALKAKALVERYVKVGDKVNLVFDKSKRDKYGRLLAYVYSKTGRNLAVLQLQAGYAKQWVIGKNDRFWRCFQKAERKARIRKKGVWSGFTPLQAKEISKDNKGYQTISGQISEVTKSKKGILFFLDKRLLFLLCSLAYEV
jgi:endonuclease YncB( thermonuclease family)